MDAAQVQQAYSAVADLYIDLFGAADRVDAEDLALIERHFGGREGLVIDIGCGPGHLTGFLRARNVDVVGVDPVAEFVEHARRTHPTARFEQGFLDDLAAREGTVDGLLAWYSLIHLDPDQLADALDACRRLLVPGAPLVVGFFTADAVGAFPHKVCTAYRWPADELSRLLAAAGLREVDRLLRPAAGERRAHGAIAALAV